MAAAIRAGVMCRVCGAAAKGMTRGELYCSDGCMAIHLQKMDDPSIMVPQTHRSGAVPQAEAIKHAACRVVLPEKHDEAFLAISLEAEYINKLVMSKRRHEEVFRDGLCHFVTNVDMPGAGWIAKQAEYIKQLGEPEKKLLDRYAEDSMGLSMDQQLAVANIIQGSPPVETAFAVYRGWRSEKEKDLLSWIGTSKCLAASKKKVLSTSVSTNVAITFIDDSGIVVGIKLAPGDRALPLGLVSPLPEREVIIPPVDLNISPPRRICVRGLFDLSTRSGEKSYYSSDMTILYADASVAKPPIEPDPSAASYSSFIRFWPFR